MADADASSRLPLGQSRRDESHGRCALGVFPVRLVAMSSLSHHIGGVVGLRTNEQMRRVEAASDVAVVENEALRVEVEVQPEMGCEPVDGKVRNPAFEVARLAVAAGVARERPEPAAIRVDLPVREESFLGGHARSISDTQTKSDG